MKVMKIFISHPVVCDPTPSSAQARRWISATGLEMACESVMTIVLRAALAMVGITDSRLISSSARQNSAPIFGLFVWGFHVLTNCAVSFSVRQQLSAYEVVLRQMQMYCIDNGIDARQIPCHLYIGSERETNI